MEDVFPVDHSQAAGLLFASSDEKNRSPHPDEAQGRSPQEKKLGNRVLVVGRLRELALYRAEILRQAGFIASTAEDENEAIRMIQRAAFDAVVLSYTLPKKTAQYLAEMARYYCEDCAVIAIADNNTPDHPIAADITAIADEGPAGLVSALKQVLRPAS